MKRLHQQIAAIALVAGFSPLAAQAGDTTAAAQLTLWQAQAGTAASAERGRTCCGAINIGAHNRLSIYGRRRRIETVKTWNSLASFPCAA